MIQNLLSISEVMQRVFPEDKLAVIYDRGPYGGAALSAFNSFKNTSSKEKAKYITTIAPRSGEDCVALQPADLIAFEGRKLVAAEKRDPYYFRRSLKRMLGNGNFVRVREINKDVFEKIIEARKLAPSKPDDVHPVG